MSKSEDIQQAKDFMRVEFARTEGELNMKTLIRTLREEFLLDDEDISQIAKELITEEKVTPNQRAFIDEAMNSASLNMIFDGCLSICRFTEKVFPVMRDYLERRIADARPSELALLQSAQNCMPSIERAYKILRPCMDQYVKLLKEYHKVD